MKRKLKIYHYPNLIIHLNIYGSSGFQDVIKKSNDHVIEFSYLDLGSTLGFGAIFGDFGDTGEAGDLDSGDFGTLRLEGVLGRGLGDARGAAEDVGDNITRRT